MVLCVHSKLTLTHPHQSLHPTVRQSQHPPHDTYRIFNTSATSQNSGAPGGATGAVVPISTPYIAQEAQGDAGGSVGGGSGQVGLEASPHTLPNPLHPCAHTPPSTRPQPIQMPTQLQQHMSQQPQLHSLQQHMLPNESTTDAGTSGASVTHHVRSLSHVSEQGKTLVRSIEDEHKDRSDSVHQGLMMYQVDQVHHQGLIMYQDNQALCTSLPVVLQHSPRPVQADEQLHALVGGFKASGPDTPCRTIAHTPSTPRSGGERECRALSPQAGAPEHTGPVQNSRQPPPAPSGAHDLANDWISHHHLLPSHAQAVEEGGSGGSAPGLSLKVTLDCPFSRCGQAATAQRAYFEEELASDLAAASGVVVGRCTFRVQAIASFGVSHLSAGSIVITVQVKMQSMGLKELLMANLERQAADGSSPLRAGRLTRMVTSIVCTSDALQPPTEFIGGRKRHVEPGWTRVEDGFGEEGFGVVTAEERFRVLVLRGLEGTLGVIVSVEDRDEGVAACDVAPYVTCHVARYVVLQVVPHGAAHRSGQVAAGDVIHAIDGVDIHSHSLKQVALMMRGKPLSSLVLTLSRPAATVHLVSGVGRGLERGGKGAECNYMTVSCKLAPQDARHWHQLPALGHSLQAGVQSVMPVALNATHLQPSGPSHEAKPHIAHAPGLHPSCIAHTSGSLQPSSHPLNWHPSASKATASEPIPKTGVQGPVGMPSRSAQVARQDAHSHTPAEARGVTTPRTRASPNYDTGPILLSKREQMVVVGLKEAIEHSDTPRVLAMHTDIMELAATVKLQAPDAGMRIYTKLGAAYIALPRHTPTQYIRGKEALQCAHQLAKHSNNSQALGEIAYEMAVAHEALDDLSGAREWLGTYVAFASELHDTQRQIGAFIRLGGISSWMPLDCLPLDCLSLIIDGSSFAGSRFVYAGPCSDAR